MASQTSKSFKVIVPSFNSIRYLPKTLRSLENQQTQNFDVCVVDDASTLPQQRDIISDFCQRNGWRSLFRSVNKGPLSSIIDGIRQLNCQDEDVIVILDGDDWLAHDRVFETLEKAYRSPHVFLTYGSFKTYPENCLNITYAASLKEEEIEQQLYRQMRWIFQPLRSFKYHLWKRIKDEDLRDENGEYYNVTGDRAFFYPLLEMAGSHILFIDQILYVYNLDNPLNDHKINREEQLRAEYRIKSLPKYPALP